jgi:hypothetical protein
MREGRLTRRVAASLGIGAFIAMGALTACGGGEQGPSTETTTTTTTTTTPPSTAAPTEKSINPTGGNLFSPSVIAPGPPTPAPGNLPGNN